MNLFTLLFGTATDTAVTVREPLAMTQPQPRPLQPIPAREVVPSTSGVQLVPTRTTYSYSEPNQLKNAWVTSDAFYLERQGGVQFFKGRHISDVEVRRTGPNRGSIWVTFLNGKSVYLADLVNYVEFGEALRLMALRSE